MKYSPHSSEKDSPGARGSVIRAGSMEGYRSFLFELGVDPLPVLERAGLDNEIFSDPDTVISTECYRRALNHAAITTGLRHFGLLLSQRQAFEKLGAVGYLVRHAPNLRVSIERLILHFRTHDTGSMTELETEDNCALWLHRLSGVIDAPAIQQTELAVGLACRFVRSALGETWCPQAVYFEHQAPRDVSPFQAVFRCPVLFGQTLTGLEIATPDLDKPLRQSDPGLFKILEQHVTQIEKGMGDDFSASVRTLILQDIESGTVRIETAAARMGLRKHVLQRRLKAEGTNFQAILDDVRYEIGRRYLLETDTPISEIAGILGYAESAVFTRAFARRSGMAPRLWRQTHTAS
ncbi:AraC family transcriptional regulator [Novosphingobium sp. ZN18A2]|uniref:AraC family transcriptional regulator n=1 Tax=Novosphingobium sp. ZN18A2 TaxID=3079861 RepID=UPI0030D0100B